MAVIGQRAVGEPSEPPSRFRKLAGWPRHAVSVGFVILSLLGLTWGVNAPGLVGVTFFSEQYLSIFLGLSTALVFLLAKSRENASDIVPWYDVGCALGAIGFGGYCAIVFPTIAYSLSVVTWDKVLFGALAITLILEATRRLFGWTLVLLAVVLCLYARFGYVLPGLLYTRGVSWERLATYVFLDSNGIFGIALTVTATVVASFIFFGRALQAVGGGAFFTDISLALMGRYRGGPAKVAVTSSAAFGMMSGSVVSNVVVSGSITIPLMTRHGYSRDFAAATEAAGSTGGQIMPPVMGIAAFIMAENLGVNYGQIALAALIPALLYFVALFLQVDLEARRFNLPALPENEIRRLSTVLRQGWPYLLPLATLIYTLVFAHWNAGQAGVAAAATALAVGLVKHPQMRSLSVMLTLLRDCGRLLVDIAVVSALAGIVIGALNLSGLSFTLSMVLSGLAQYGLFLLLVVTAFACIVFGMGMPTTVIYVMLSVMVAPALIEVGVAPISAHLFIFYFGMLSMLTPPVCMASITAAALARASFWKTAFTGMRLGVAAYIVPFFFVYHPQLLLHDINAFILLELLATSGGVIMVAIGAAGFLRSELGFGLRVGFVLSGLCLASPTTTPLALAITIGGLVTGAFVLVLALVPASKLRLSRGGAD